MRNDLFSEDIISEERCAVVLALVMGLLYVASFAALFALPEMPVRAYEALAWLPSSPSIAGIQVAGR
jgi:hypothetical protein